MKEGFLMSIRNFRVITIIVAFLMWQGVVYQVRAESPQPALQSTPTAQPPADESGSEQATSSQISITSPMVPAPALVQDATSAGANNPIQSMATAGHWTGTTNQGRPMSFDVFSSGNQWDSFKVQVTFSNCNVLLTYTLFGPGSINNNRFSGTSTDGVFSVSGQFNSATTASGTFRFSNISIPGCGNQSQSGTWTATVPSPPAPLPNPPSNLTAQALSRMQILLSWQDNSNNETGFKIERSLASTGPWTQIATTSANVTSHAPTGLTCDTRYYFRARAYNANGNSLYSNTANAKTLTCVTVPSAPSNLTATPVSKTQINLTWKDNSTNETGFRIERSPNQLTWTQIASVGPNATTYANTGLTCGSAYFYRVRAYNLSGNSLYSNIDGVAPLPCPDADINVFLPSIMKNFAPPTPSPPGSKPVDGHWTGTTSRSQPMSFNVSSGGTSLNTFKLKTDFKAGPCSGTTEITIPSPRPITNNQFSGSGGSFSYSGKFNTPTSASGTYAYTNHVITNCGILNQSGTWTANIP